MRLCKKVSLAVLAALSLLQLPIIKLTQNTPRDRYSELALPHLSSPSSNSSSSSSSRSSSVSLNEEKDGLVARKQQNELKGQPWKSLPKCQPLNATGMARNFTKSVQDPAELEHLFAQWHVKEGGDYSPPDCASQQRMAILIPYRNRSEHLHILLFNLVPFLIRQQASFTVFVIEQAGDSIFNKGLLMNVGFLEALKRDNYSCFIFHDVDLIPVDDRILYRCGEQPLHLAAAIDKFGFKLLFDNILGGAAAFSRQQYEAVNGFSNLHVGWGGEDTDIYTRVNHTGMKVARYPLHKAHYVMIKHEPDQGNPLNPLRYRLQRTSRRRMATDGLNSVTYDHVSVKVKPLYTWLVVTFSKDEVLKTAPKRIQRLYHINNWETE